MTNKTKKDLLKKVWDNCTFDEIIDAGFEFSKCGAIDLKTAAAEFDDPKESVLEDIISESPIEDVMEAVKSEFTIEDIIGELDRDDILDCFDNEDILYLS